MPFTGEQTSWRCESPPGRFPSFAAGSPAGGSCPSHRGSCGDGRAQRGARRRVCSGAAPGLATQTHSPMATRGQQAEEGSQGVPGLTTVPPVLSPAAVAEDHTDRPGVYGTNHR